MPDAAKAELMYDSILATLRAVHDGIPENLTRLDEDWEDKGVQPLPNGLHVALIELMQRNGLQPPSAAPARVVLPEQNEEDYDDEAGIAAAMAASEAVQQQQTQQQQQQAQLRAAAQQQAVPAAALPPRPAFGYPGNGNGNGFAAAAAASPGASAAAYARAADRTAHSNGAAGYSGHTSTNHANAHARPAPSPQATSVVRHFERYQAMEASFVSGGLPNAAPASNGADRSSCAFEGDSGSGGGRSSSMLQSILQTTAEAARAAVQRGELQSHRSGEAARASLHMWDSTRRLIDDAFASSTASSADGATETAGATAAVPTFSAVSSNATARQDPARLATAYADAVEESSASAVQHFSSRPAAAPAGPVDYGVETTILAERLEAVTISQRAVAAPPSRAAAPAAPASDDIPYHVMVGVAGELFALRYFKAELPGFGDSNWASSFRSYIGLPPPRMEPPFDFVYEDTEGKLCGVAGARCLIEVKTTSGDGSLAFYITEAEWRLAQQLEGGGPDGNIFYVVVRVERALRQDADVAAVLVDPVAMLRRGALQVAPQEGTNLVVGGFQVAA